MTEWADAACVIVAARTGPVLVNAGPRGNGPVAFVGGPVDRREDSHDDPWADAARRELKTQTGLSLERQDLLLAGAWVTPEYTRQRTRVRCFVAVLDRPADLSATARSNGVVWVEPNALVERFQRLQLVLSFPSRAIVDALSLGADGARRRLLAILGTHDEVHLDFEPVSGIRQLPLRTPTLPPATTTNTYVIGHESLIVVDPATYEADERDKLALLLTELTDRGASIQAVVLTHHHPDHIGSARWLAERYDVPIWAHHVTAELLEHRIKIDRHLDEGDELNLGEDPHAGPFRLEVLFTPGHAPGHVCLADRRRGARALIVGDMVASTGTILIDPSEGDMTAYLAQLERLRAFEEPILMPAHGPPIVDGEGKLAHYIAHRRMRESKVLRALEVMNEGTPSELLAVAYDDTPAHLYPLAARSCLAHLLKLEADGLATRSGERFRKR